MSLLICNEDRDSLISPSLPGNGCVPPLTSESEMPLTDGLQDTFCRGHTFFVCSTWLLHAVIVVIPATSSAILGLLLVGGDRLLLPSRLGFPDVLDSFLCPWPASPSPSTLVVPPLEAFLKCSDFGPMWPLVQGHLAHLCYFQP